MSTKYTNPNNPHEFVVIVSSSSLFGVKAIIHHTPYGYLDKSWFTTFVPELDLYAQNYENAVRNIPPQFQGKQREDLIRREFSANINDNINPKFSSGMTIEQIKATNAFFHKYLPDVEGICKICFRLSLPKTGPGVRWYSPIISRCEVRLSEPKPHGYPNQQKLYLTHNYQINQETLHVKWNGIITEVPIFDKVLRQPDTHIPWENYDYEDIVHRLPSYQGHQILVCQCKKVP